MSWDLDELPCVMQYRDLARRYSSTFVSLGQGIRDEHAAIKAERAALTLAGAENARPLAGTGTAYISFARLWKSRKLFLARSFRAQAQEELP